MQAADGLHHHIHLRVGDDLVDVLGVDAGDLLKGAQVHYVFDLDLRGQLIPDDLIGTVTDDAQADDRNFHNTVPPVLFLLLPYRMSILAMVSAIWTAFRAAPLRI